jgi:hypothetical protein
MRILRSRFLVLLLLLSVFPAYSQHPMNPGDNAPGPLPGTRPAELPPDRQTSALASRSPEDIARLQQDAKELAELSASIPSDIDHVSKGMLPKDVLEKLKRVEKLSKHLRNELMP